MAGWWLGRPDELETRHGWVMNAARLVVAAPWIVQAPELRQQPSERDLVGLRTERPAREGSAVELHAIRTRCPLWTVCQWVCH